MPRILRIINRLNLGGPTYNAGILTKYLSPDFDTMLVAGMKDESEASSAFIVEDLGLSPAYIKNMYREISPINDWKAYQEIRTIIQEFNPDIVHTHASKAGTLGRLAAKHSGVPVIVHTFHGHVFHSYFGSAKTLLYKQIERYLAGISTKIIAISPEQKKELSVEHNITSADNIAVIPLGFDLKRFSTDTPGKRQSFRQKYGLREEHIAIGIIGRFVPIKNHEMFLAAFSQLKRSNLPVKAFLIGDGEIREAVLSAARQLGLSVGHNADSDVIFTSWITEIDKATAGLDIIALSSLNEGTPVSIIEAQAAGKPVVSTNVGGVADTMIDTESGLLVPSNDHIAMSAALENLASNPDLRQKMGVAGRDFVQNKYHFSALVRNFANLYRELLTNI